MGISLFYFDGQFNVFNYFKQIFFRKLNFNDKKHLNIFTKTSEFNPFRLDELFELFIFGRELLPSLLNGVSLLLKLFKSILVDSTSFSFLTFSLSLLPETSNELRGFAFRCCDHVTVFKSSSNIRHGGTDFVLFSVDPESAPGISTCEECSEGLGVKSHGKPIKHVRNKILYLRYKPVTIPFNISSSLSSNRKMLFATIVSEKFKNIL